MNKLASSRPVRYAVGLVVALSTVVVATAAYAGTYTGTASTDATQAQSDILSFLGTMVSSIAPVLIAVALGVIGIVILGWGIRTVFHKVRGAAHF